MIAKALRSTAGNSSGGQIHLAHECAKTGIVDYPLEKLLILAATLRFAGKKEIVQSDGGSAEGIGLDDNRAGLQILDVNLLGLYCWIMVPTAPSRTTMRSRRSASNGWRPFAAMIIPELNGVSLVNQETN